MKHVNIVMSFDDNYSLAALVAIYTLLKNANNNTYYNIYIFISDNLSDKNINKIKQLESNYNTKIIFMEVTKEFENVQINNDLHVNKNSFYRLLIPWMLPNIDKVLYLDVDITVHGDLSELYELNIDEYYIAAAREYVYIECMLNGNDNLIKGEIDNLLKLENVYSYVNVGISLINSRKMREDNLLPKFIEESKIPYRCGDQDILNKVCEKKVYFFTSKYNANYDRTILYHKYLSKEDFYEYWFFPKIVHYYGDSKPWSKFRENRMHTLWWESYIQSPFFDIDFFYYNNLSEYFNIVKEAKLRNKIGNEIRNQIYNEIKNNISKEVKNEMYIQHINKIAWWIPVKKWRDNFRNKMLK